MKEEEVTAKLHRCPTVWLKIGVHPCWRVQKALDEAGVEYELVLGPLGRSKRTEIARLSGQSLYPVIELEDGRIYREESRKMAARIRAGELYEAATAPPGGSS
ncbi:MAG: glutathione S-transferase N-terminal domain-containing protein [Gaiellaceae bacterium]|jgi:glutathione S-transferase